MNKILLFFENLYNYINIFKLNRQNKELRRELNQLYGKYYNLQREFGVTRFDQNVMTVIKLCEENEDLKKQIEKYPLIILEKFSRKLLEE